MQQTRIAITRKLPESFINAISQDTNREPISFQRALQQHENYVSKLKQYIPNVIELPSDEQLPDCCFVEDPVLIINDMILLTEVAPKSRKGESQIMKQLFEKNGLFQGKSIHIMREMDPEATLEGGDVLVLHEIKTIFIGLTSRTNEKGVEIVRKIFCKEFNVVGIEMRHYPGLHLKTFVTYLANERRNNVLIPIVTYTKSIPVANEIVQQMSKNTKHEIRFVDIPDLNSVNVLSIPIQDGKFVVLTRALKEKFPNSFEIVEKLAKELPHVHFEAIENDEFIKADGCLTCCSVLL